MSDNFEVGEFFAYPSILNRSTQRTNVVMREVTVWTLNLLGPTEVHYIEKNPGMFSSKNLNYFLTEERKTWTSWMTWGWVNYQEIFIQEVN